MPAVVWTPAFVLLIFLQNTPPPESRATSAPASRPAAGFLFKTVEWAQQTVAYSVYVPPQYTAQRAWPVILYLHGSATRGSDGLKQTDAGIAHAIRRNRWLCPAIVVMPQCPSNEGWTEANLRMALACLQSTAGEYRLDGQRVYLTGVSLGGGGVWTLAAWAPQQFAAVAPICGFVGRPDLPPDPAAVAHSAARFGNVPVWCFHGAQDPRVPVQHSRAMTEAIRKLGGNVKYTEYPDGAHTIWDRVYADRAFWKWLLAQQRPVTSQPSAPEEPRP